MDTSLIVLHFELGQISYVDAFNLVNMCIYHVHCRAQFVGGTFPNFLLYNGYYLITVHTVSHNEENSHGFLVGIYHSNLIQIQ